LKSTNIIRGCIYVAPSGNMHEFPDVLDDVLRYLYHPLTELIICGDTNTNCLTETENQTKLDRVHIT
jgi:hypothetical protein